MTDTTNVYPGASPTGPACPVSGGGCSGGPMSESDLVLGGGCCSGVGSPMGRRARGARFAAGAGFLALAGAMGSRRLSGRIALWPAAVVPTWFGVSHLVAGVTGYRGCPELGAIPSLLLDRPVATGCGPWDRIDGWIEPLA